MAHVLHTHTQLEGAMAQASEKFREARCYYEIYILGGAIHVEINWGDWKHDHGYVDYIMRGLGLAKLDEQVTEEDQSDCYSSTHIFV